MSKYAIGIDFGTLSGRVLVVDVATGRETATCEYPYPHAVMDTQIAGQPLPHDFALQHPGDYIGVLTTIGPLLEQSGIDARDVIGVGIDFTACTVMPVRRDGTPICQLNQFYGHPHACVKLWKHHAAQPYANELNRIAGERGEAFLPRYGGKISSEWAIPKMWQVMKEAPDVWAATDAFVEAADWVVWQLCGELRRNSCTAGYKAMWHKNDGYPSEDFFAALDPALRHVVRDKLWGDIYAIGEKAGEINDWAADVTGLLPGTAVAVANVDAHVCVPAVGIESEGKMLGIMGTSTCHMLLSREEKLVEGMCGVVEDGILPGFFGYEAGQSCVGDHFSWFIDNCLPRALYDEAQEKGQSIYDLLADKIAVQKAGQSGLVALDWWNGNRSILVDADLTGLIVGLTLHTKPEDIYRALIEATAYGARRIVEAFRDSGVAVDEFYAAGGIAQKSPQTMQIYADVLDMPIRIAGSSQGPALGSAIFGAVAAGRARGGYDDVFEAARVMGSVRDDVYRPRPDEAYTYNKLYDEYKLLHDCFGRGSNDVMKRLKDIKRAVSAQEQEA